MPNQPERFRDTSLPIIERVKDLLSRLTIEEKIHLLSTHQLPGMWVRKWHGAIFPAKRQSRLPCSRSRSGWLLPLTRTSWNS